MWMYVLALVVLYYVVRWFRELERVQDRGSKYVYITGCDSGFGNLLARHLDKCGFCVVAACFTEKGEEELKKSCSSRMSTIHLDVRKQESIDKAAAFIKEKVGQKGLWAVVNNAGVSLPSAPCDWLTLEDYKSMLTVNLEGVIGVTLSIIPLIKKARDVWLTSPVCLAGSVQLEDPIVCPNMVWNHLMTASVETMLNKKLSKMSDGDLMKVVSCMEHAVSAVHPRTRYSPGWDAKFFWLPLSYAPTCISDYLLLKDVIKPAKMVA